MKKFLSLLLASIICLSLIPTVFAATGRYIVTATVADVYFSPSSTSEKIAEVTKNTYLEITEIRNSVYGKAYIPKDDVTGWIKMDALSPADPPAADTDIKKIVVSTLPNKTVYVDGREELDLTGMIVKAVDKNEAHHPVTQYSVYAPEMKVPGEKTVRVTYCPDGVSVFEASFNVTVIRVPVKKISIINKPKTQYLENQTLDLSALSVKTEFENSAENTVLSYDQIKNNEDYTVTGCHGETHGSILSKGQHTIKITYKYSDISCEFNLNVTPRQLVSLTVKQQPNNLTVYDNTTVPSLDGLILEASYDNGEKEDIYHYNCTAVCDPSLFAVGPGNKVDVYFGGLFVTLEFRYSIAVPSKIVLEYPQNEDGTMFSLTFLKGEVIDLSGIKVRLVYTDNSFEYVDGFEISKPDYTVVKGSQNIVVSYKEFSEVFTIVISEYFSKGDIDGNGIISALDARQALRASVGLTTLSGMTFFAGDADRNGKISAVDARLILRASVGLENLYITL